MPTDADHVRAAMTELARLLTNVQELADLTECHHAELELVRATVIDICRPSGVAEIVVELSEGESVELEWHTDDAVWELVWQPEAASYGVRAR